MLIIILQPGIGRPNPFIKHTITVQYILDVPGVNPESVSCPEKQLVVKDESGGILGSTPPRSGSSRRVRVKPIVYKCVYSFRVQKIPEIPLYHTNLAGNISLKEMRSKDWNVVVGSMEVDMDKQLTP